MVPDAEPGLLGMQLPEKRWGANPATGDSTIVKEPGPNVTDWVPPTVRENEDGWGLLPVTCMEKLVPGHALIRHCFSTIDY